MGTLTDTPARATSSSAEALIEEARRRQRRRRLWIAAAVPILVSALVAGLLLAGGSGSPSASTAGKPTSPARQPSRIRTAPLTGPFVPEQVVSAAGKAWVIGTTQASGPDTCQIEEVDPTTLRTRSYPLPLCGPDVAVDGSRIFIAAVAYTPERSEQIHIESFDTASGTAKVMAPVVYTTVGSGEAHLGFAYGDGSLWLTFWGGELQEISPATGAPVRTITGVSTGPYPQLVATRSGLWITGGAGTPALVDRIAPGSDKAHAVFRRPASDVVLWLSAVGDRVWAGVASDAPTGRRAHTRLVAFDSSGHEVLATPIEQIGDTPLVAIGDHLWTLGSGISCSGPQHLWSVDARTGRSTARITLRSPVGPCSTAGRSQLVAVGRTLFVLDPTGMASPSGMLFRIGG